MAQDAPRIVAPVCSVREAEQLMAAGADEFYCGAMLDEWVGVFGDADLLTRRQGRLSHFESRKELGTLLRLCADAGRPVALTLNARYSRVTEPTALALAEMWEQTGGEAVIVTDLGILLALRNRHPRLKLRLSLLAGAFNSASVAFFARLGISRAILPRDLTVKEIGDLIARFSRMEYEALVLNQKCQFIDGFCGFYHATRLPGDVPAAFNYEVPPDSAIPVVRSHDPDYEGHGCEIAWHTKFGPVRHVRHDDYHAPHCAACWLGGLWQAGVRYFKIAGRAYPTEILTRSVRFLREAIDISSAGDDSERTSDSVQRLYAQTFGEPCDPSRCYHALDGIGETI